MLAIGGCYPSFPFEEVRSLLYGFVSIFFLKEKRDICIRAQTWCTLLLHSKITQYLSMPKDNFNIPLIQFPPQINYLTIYNVRNGLIGILLQGSFFRFFCTFWLLLLFNTLSNTEVSLITWFPFFSKRRKNTEV